MANIEEMKMKHFVLKNEDIKKYLTLEEKVQLNGIEACIDSERMDDGKQPASKNVYLVINTDEPYADEVIEILKRNGHWG